MTGNVYEHR